MKKQELGMAVAAIALGLRPTAAKRYPDGLQKQEKKKGTTDR